MGLVGLTPGKLATILAAEYKRTVLDGVNTDSVDPFKTAIAAGLDSQQGWAMTVSGFAQQGWNQMVDHRVFYVLTWLVALIVLLFAFAFEVRQREEKLLSLAGEGEGEGEGEGAPAHAEEAGGGEGEGGVSAQPSGS